MARRRHAPRSKGDSQAAQIYSEGHALLASNNEQGGDDDDVAKIGVEAKANGGTALQ